MAAHLVQMRVLPQPHLLHAVRGEQPAGAAAAHRALQVAVICGAGHCTRENEARGGETSHYTYKPTPFISECAKNTPKLTTYFKE